MEDFLEVAAWTGSVIRPDRTDTLRCARVSVSDETAKVVFVASEEPPPPPLVAGEGSFVLSWKDATFASGKLERPEIFIDRIKARITLDRATWSLSFSANATDLKGVLERRAIIVPRDFEKELK